MKLFICLSIIFYLTEKSFCWRVGEIKYWLPNLDWATPSNWVNDIKPDVNSRVVFPLEIHHSVGLPSNSLLQLAGIELPRDGSILLSRNGNLELSVSEKNNKDNKISTWKLKGPFYWVDPDNWSNSNKAIPHFERVPCSMDTVVLPDINHSLSIRFPNVNVKVKEIKTSDDETIDEWRWHTLMSGREFQNSPHTVGYSGLQYCETECICKPDNAEELLNEICIIETPRCEKRACEFPLPLEDHCCDYCGGRVSVSSKKISISKLGEIAQEAFKNNKEIYWHARLTLNSKEVEILLAERGIYSGIKSQEAIDKLVGLLMVKGIPVVKAMGTGAPLTGSAFANTLGPMFGIPIVILIIIFLALPYFGYSYTQVLSIWREAYGSVRDGIRPDDGFARFENLLEGDVQLSGPNISDNEDEQDNSAGGSSVGEGGGKRFENPLYRSTRKSTEQKDLQDDTQSIINIDIPVSLTQLKNKVYSSENPTVDSD
ncbi:protein amnionless-like [Microplitis mediator]|uniref:protein amnionless-like n=1 Tax=Microplitis mediator TaxID=375433 RepID=UPI0025534013|nr:protein amnionless-like [Microplitis mediator]